MVIGQDSKYKEENIEIISITDARSVITIHMCDLCVLQNLYTCTA